MLHKETSLEEIINNMRALGDLLIPFNFPRVPLPSLMEDELAIFKERESIIDGYPVVLHYQKSDYDDYLIETLQIYGKNSPFLPFNLVVKLATRFLGGHHLSLVEIFKDGRKIYIWSVCIDPKGKPMSFPFDVEFEECVFEDFKYIYLQPSQMNFY